MKFVTKAAVVGTALIATTFGAGAAQAATANADARARILQQVTVTRTADLDFGTIVTGAAPSTVDVAGNGTRTCGAGLTCSGATTAAAFNVVGTSGQVVTIATSGPVTLNAAGGFTMSASLVPSSSTLLLAGSDSFSVGGSLGVAAGQADGNYVGTFSVTVDYQ